MIVEEYTKENPTDRKFARKSLMDWSTFGRDTGSRVSTGTMEATKAYTARSFITRCTKRFGLSQEDSITWWEQFYADTSIRRTNTGFGGSEELHIAKSASFPPPKQKIMKIMWTTMWHSMGAS